jgi:hypothetical protein
LWDVLCFEALAFAQNYGRLCIGAGAKILTAKRSSKSPLLLARFSENAVFGRVTLCVRSLTLIDGSLTVRCGLVGFFAELVTVGGATQFFGGIFCRSCGRDPGMLLRIAAEGLARFSWVG